MRIKPMHEWFHKHLTTATFAPGAEVSSRPTHLKIRDSLRKMAASMRIEKCRKENERGWNATVVHFGYKYFLDLSVNEKGSNYASDYKPVAPKDTVPLLKEIIGQKIRIIHILLRRDWAQILFSYGGKKYSVRLLLLYTPPQMKKVYEKTL